MLTAHLRYVTRSVHRSLPGWCSKRRSLLTLAIETSCDDTSVALLEKNDNSKARLHFHKKITADNSANRGIHPAVAVASHQEHLSGLIDESLRNLPELLHSRYGHGPGHSLTILSNDGKCLQKRKPDLVSVTRGPGMTAALTTGLDTAKGLSLAWQVPLIGVNHMHAHALTPRLVHALNHDGPIGEVRPEFPFLTLLVSGGHTLLVYSNNKCDHSILASTADIAVGDAIDKMARSILPADELADSEIMYGRTLERFAFEHGYLDCGYRAPTSRAQEIAEKMTQWGWALPIPLAEGKHMSFTFSGLGSAVKRVCDSRSTSMDHDERVHMARESMRVAFEHLAMRVIWTLQDMQIRGQKVKYLVVSGGVASNGFLKAIMRTFLDARQFSHVQLVCPPVELCTDNAAMIAWTGIEMYVDGWMTDLRCRALRKWSIDSKAEGGGILGVPGWKRRTAHN